MSIIKIGKTELKLIDVGSIEYIEATTKDITEDDLEKIIEENTECIIDMPKLAEDFIKE